MNVFKKSDGNNSFFTAFINKIRQKILQFNKKY